MSIARTVAESPNVLDHGDQAATHVADRLASAARKLAELRENWLNPAEWTTEETLAFPGSVDGPWGRLVTAPNERGIGTVQYIRRVAKDDQARRELSRRSLTNL